MGGWFSRSEGGIAEYRRDFTALEQRIDTLERSNRGLKLEWETVYDKLMKAAARLNARTRRATADETALEDTVATLAEEQTTQGTHAILSEARARRGR